MRKKIMTIVNIGLETPIKAISRFVPKRAIHKYGIFSYFNMFNVHTSDTVFITFVRNDIITSEKQD